MLKWLAALAFVIGVPLGGGQFIVRPPAPSTTCAFPTCFPDATNTGYLPTGVTLTAYSGPTTITVANTIIDSKDISSCLLINANNVTIKRSRIQCSGDYMIDNFATGSGGGTGLVIQDTTFIGGAFVKGSSAVSTSNFTLTRVNISNVENGVYADGPSVTVQDSFIHNLYCYDAINDPHIDGVQVAAAGTGVTVTHNTIYGTCDHNGAGEGGNSAFFMHVGTNISVANNLLGGGGYTAYCNEAAPGATDFYTNNRFTTRFVASLVGSFGPTAECDDETHFTGNICYESGTALTGSSTSCPAPPQPIADLRKWLGLRIKAN